jgi:hypothetical protein
MAGSIKLLNKPNCIAHVLIFMDESRS